MPGVPHLERAACSSGWCFLLEEIGWGAIVDFPESFKGDLKK